MWPRVVLLLAALSAARAEDTWLARVAAVMNGEEQRRYASLTSGEQREAFQAAFWEGKALSATEYFERSTYVDEKFGSGKAGSGAHTDQGRVYLAIGPPNQIMQLPSSRILQPLEIWRYDHVEGLPVSSEIQLLFFRARGVGFPKLYSPQIHSARALLINNAGTRGTFPVNDIVTADDLHNRLQLSPAEMEAVDAAMSVARGVRGSGNSELLYLVSSPAAMMRRPLREKVKSRLFPAPARPELTSEQYRTNDRIPATDLTVTATVMSQIGLEVPGLEVHETRLDFSAPRPVTYRQRLYLLPGEWDVAVVCDGQRRVFRIHVAPLREADPMAPRELEARGEPEAVPVVYRANLSRQAQWISVGRQYLRAADTGRASFCFAKALAEGPATADALAGQGRLLAMQGKLDTARTLLQEALRLEPRHYEALMALAAVTAGFQDYPQAMTYYRQAATVRPSQEIETALRELSRR